MKFLASEVATITGGDLIGPDVTVEGASIDSRELVEGQLFVPIVADRDGHDFIAVARRRGAPAHLTSSGLTSSGPGPDEADDTAIVVADTARALAELGAAARDRLDGIVVGITGSVGKTTTKDLTAAVLARRFATHANLRSFNNELGVPLTLVTAPDGTAAAVIEMGARGAGHILDLCRIARPTIGVVTTVELVHTEHFGGIEQVAEAKRELIEALPADGTAVLYADNPVVARMAPWSAGDVVTFGVEGGDVRAESITVDDDLHPSFQLVTPWGTTAVRLEIRGRHNVGNALAAAAVGLVAGVPIDEVAAGLAQGSASPWRMDLQTAPSGVQVLNDAYNAGPASMRAALESLAHLDARRRIAVLGTMAELGDHALDAHTAVAALAAELGIELIAVGTTGYGVAAVDGPDEVLARLGPLGPGDAVLVKGSRVAGLERVAAALLHPVPDRTA